VKQFLVLEEEMSDPALSLEDRVHLYPSHSGKRLVASLGFGHDGDVYSTDVQTAVKFFRDPEVFQRELRCYQRLKECGVDEVLGHAIPQLISWDEELLALEMSIVRRPYLLDFASALLDWPPDFSPEVLEEWSRRKAMEFGTHWPKIQLILAILADRYGVYLTDIHRGNIAFDSNDWESCTTSP
jgi:hypothetical protein